MAEQIKAIHVLRLKARAFGLTDPCFICGGKFHVSGVLPGYCGHSITDTQTMIERVRKLGATERERILKEEDI